MRGFKPNDVEDSVARDEFLLQFNRLYVSQRYVEAYDWCLQNLKTSYREEAKRKAASCCPKLTKRIVLSKTPLSYDDIIDVFAPLKCKMKITPNGLRVSTIYFKRERELGKTVVTFKRSVFRNLAVVILTLLGGFLSEVSIVPLLCWLFKLYEGIPYSSGIDSSHTIFWFVIITTMIIIGLIPFYYLYRMFRSQNNIFKYFTNALIK